MAGNSNQSVIYIARLVLNGKNINFFKNIRGNYLGDLFLSGYSICNSVKHSIKGVHSAITEKKDCNIFTRMYTTT